MLPTETGWLMVYITLLIGLIVMRSLLDVLTAEADWLTVYITLLKGLIVLWSLLAVLTAEADWLTVYITLLKGLIVLWSLLAALNAEAGRLKGRWTGGLQHCRQTSCWHGADHLNKQSLRMCK